MLCRQLTPKYLKFYVCPPRRDIGIVTLRATRPSKSSRNRILPELAWHSTKTYPYAIFRRGPSEKALALVTFASGGLPGGSLSIFIPRL